MIAFLSVTLSAAIATSWLAALWMMTAGYRRIPSLAEQPPIEDSAPRVSIVVAARNEAGHIGAAMQSLLDMSWPDLEIIAVNDRSTDATGDILEKLARHEPRLMVIHINELPDGWLGKLNAMQQGANRAGGELLLFSDGDVYFHADALSRAVRYMQENGIDHLCSVPRLVNTHWSMRIMVPVFSILLFTQARPWKVHDPDSSAHIGIGAFNLIRRECLQAIGGFEPIRLRPDDDIKLGKLVKQHGFRQGFIDAGGLLNIEWYHNAAEMIRGLEKNSFAFLDYSVPRTIAAALGVLAACVWPLAGAWAGPPLAGMLYIVSILVMLGLGVEICRRQELGMQWGLLFPVGGVLMVVALLNSMFRTLRQDGIEWRGTLYPLERLRRNRL